MLEIGCSVRVIACIDALEFIGIPHSHAIRLVGYKSVEVVGINKYDDGLDISVRTPNGEVWCLSEPMIHKNGNAPGTRWGCLR